MILFSIYLYIYIYTVSGQSPRVLSFWFWMAPKIGREHSTCLAEASLPAVAVVTMLLVDMLSFSNFQRMEYDEIRWNDEMTWNNGKHSKATYRRGSETKSKGFPKPSMVDDNWECTCLARILCAQYCSISAKPVSHGFECLSTSWLAEHDCKGPRCG